VLPEITMTATPSSNSESAIVQQATAQQDDKNNANDSTLQNNVSFVTK
jgi:hypothetical protein